MGKLGLDCAEVFAEKYQVFGYDIYERHSDKVEVCGDIEVCINSSEWIFIAVPTPHEKSYDGSVPSSHLAPKDFDYSDVKSVLNKINQTAVTGKNIVLISTVLPGTTRKQLRPCLDPKHRLIYNPYLIAMGSVKWDMVNPEMIIIGAETSDQPIIKQLIDIYFPLMQNNPRYETGTWEEAESIKIFYNTFISAKLSLVNMIQDFALKIGNIDVDVVTNALARSQQRIMGPKYMTAGMGDAGACHPRDNIALRWLAQQYTIGYDLFDTIMHAREIQAENLAKHLIDISLAHGGLPIVIHGKAYKPDVEYCIGSYSTLVGHYVTKHGHTALKYVDPLADDPTDVVTDLAEPAVILWAHNRKITYEYTGAQADTKPYCEIPAGSIIVDPWRTLDSTETYEVIHYGNTKSVV